MKEVEQRLRELKKEIQQAEMERAELTGRKNSLLGRLENEFNCKSVKAAQILLTKKKKELGKVEKDVTAGLKKLEEDYEW